MCPLKHLWLVPGDPSHVLRRQDKQPSDQNAFGRLTVPVGGGLKGFARRFGETVQVQAVVPIRAPDEGQPVRPKAFKRVTQGVLQVVIQRASLRADSRRLPIVGDI
jgi:hypothetical protein